MKPARYFVREDQHAWLKRQARSIDGANASQILRIFIDLGIAQVTSGAVKLETELAQREGAGS